MVSINNIQINNQMFSDDEYFDFPIVLNMKQQKTMNKLSNIKPCLKYVSQEINQLGQTNSAITILFVIDKSTYSTPGNYQYSSLLIYKLYLDS